MKRTLFALLAALALASCSAPKHIKYFQDSFDGSLDQLTEVRSIRIQPGDKISIIVSSKDPQLMNLFNLPYVSQRIGQSTELKSSSSNSGMVCGYMVDSEGCIDFPVLGKVKLQGLTREEVTELIKYELISRNLVKDAIVTVDYMNLTVSVMGEVNSPGRFAIDKDVYTILDALSAAGDLTIFGLRENVKVLRTVGDQKQTYIVNLADSKATMSSPVYFMQQNDVIYVEPNNMRSRQSTVNGNNVLSASFWISLASLATSIAVLVVK